MRFSKKELIDLTKAWLAVSLAFTIASIGIRAFSSAFAAFITFFLISAFAAGLGFLLHELAHKFLAQKYKALAEFRSDDKMLLVMLGISLFGFIFAAPGAVIIHGHLSFDKHGKIALAGPLMNIILAIAFYALTFVLGPIASYGAQLNAWLAVFNLLPFGPMDGVKVLAWNRYVWALAGIAALALLFVPTLI